MAVQPDTPLTAPADGRGLAAAWLGLAAAAYAGALLSGTAAGPALFTAVMMFGAVCFVPAAGRNETRFAAGRMTAAAGMMAIMLLPFYAGLAACYPLALTTVIGLIAMGWAECVFWTFIMRCSRILFRIALFAAVLLPLLAGMLALRSPVFPALFRISPLGMAWYSALTGRWTGLGGLMAVHAAVLTAALISRQLPKGVQ